MSDEDIKIDLQELSELNLKFGVCEIQQEIANMMETNDKLIILYKSSASAVQEVT